MQTDSAVSELKKKKKNRTSVMFLGYHKLNKKTSH